MSLELCPNLSFSQSKDRKLSLGCGESIVEQGYTGQKNSPLKINTCYGYSTGKGLGDGEIQSRINVKNKP